MKARKITSILFASLAVVTLVAVCLCFVPTVAFAEADASSEFTLRKGNANNFVYSAQFTPDADETQDVGLVFGVSGEASYWTVTANLANGKVTLSNKSATLKSAKYAFESGAQFELTVVVNEGIARVFVNGGNVAVITCKLDGYSGGQVGVKKADFAVAYEQFASTDTLVGDIFCNGYSIVKVVNVTDGQRLTESEYSMSKGVLTVSREYLKTLEADTEYTFRVVTSFTDLDFTLTTDFTPATATPVLKKYYRGSDVTIELSGGAVASKLLIDGREFEFEQTGDKVVISSEVVAALTSGQHKAKLYTDIGRPEATFTLSEPIETLTEIEPEATHTYFWIDIAIFATLILAYVVFTVVKKTKKK